jgi:hypothetical protein
MSDKQTAVELAQIVQEDLIDSLHDLNFKDYEFIVPRPGTLLAIEKKVP